MSLNFAFKAAELLQECIHFFGPLCIEFPSVLSEFVRFNFGEMRYMKVTHNTVMFLQLSW